MANSQTWHCAVCGSTNSIADTECETCKSPRPAPGAASGAGLARGVRVEASRGHGPNSPYGAMLADPGSTGASPTYRPAAPAGEATAQRTAIGWAAGLAIVAGLYFLYQYVEGGRPAPSETVAAAPTAPAPAPTTQSVDDATWAASASATDLRAAIPAGGPRAAAAQNELRAREDIAWRGATADGSIERLAAFLQEWPSGARAEEARTQISAQIAALPSAPFGRRVVSPTRAAMREAPSQNATVLAYVEANQVLAPRRSVRNNSQNWFVLTHTDGRSGYVSYQGFQYADRPTVTAPPVTTTPPPVQRPTTPPPRVAVSPPPSVQQAPPRAGANVREASPASSIRVQYPSRARNGETGVVEVEFIVTVSGAVPSDFIEVLSETPSGRGFGDAVRQALAQSRYNPKTVNGTPEPSRVRRTFRVPPP